MSVLESLRQLRYQRAFRIAPPRLPATLGSFLETLAPRPGDAGDARETRPHEVADATRGHFLAQLGTDLWRLRSKMIEPGTDRPLDSMRRAFRHLESAWDALAAEGVTVQDHTDTPFDAGLSLKVIAFQPTPGLASERIIETIKPSVYLKGQPIQMGEVIVGTPERGPAEEPASRGAEETRA
jgi:hypothetical protein